MEIREEFNKLNFRKKCPPDIEKNFTEDYTFCTKLWFTIREDSIS